MDDFELTMVLLAFGVLDGLLEKDSNLLFIPFLKSYVLEEVIEGQH